MHINISELGTAHSNLVHGFSSQACSPAPVMLSDLYVCCKSCTVNCLFFCVFFLGLNATPIICLFRIMSQTELSNHQMYVACGCCAMLCKAALCSLCFVSGTITNVDCLCPRQNRSQCQLFSIFQKLENPKPGSMPSMHSTSVLENMIFRGDTRIRFKVEFFDFLIIRKEFLFCFHQFCPLFKR